MGRYFDTDPTLEHGMVFDTRVDIKGRLIVVPRTDDIAPLIVESSTRQTVSALTDSEMRLQTLTELRVISTLLATGLNVPDDLDTLRRDEAAALRDLR